LVACLAALFLLGGALQADPLPLPEPPPERAAPPALPEGVERFEERLGACLVTIVRPPRPNGRLLLYNHGLIFPELPLAARLDAHRDPYRTLLAEGWTLAASSYRRNGVIIRDAMADVLNLRNHLAERFGLTAPAVVIGESMGGAISIRLIEEQPDAFAGALVQGRGLLLQDPGFPGEPTFRPMRPVLLLTNRSEMTDPRTYAEVASAEHGIHVPLFTVTRPGHINFLPAEELAAVRALLGWIDAGASPPAWFDVTGESPRLPSTARFADDGAYTGVVGTHPTHGNLLLALVPEDLERLQLAPGDTLLVRVGERMILAPWMATFSDVPVGGWLCYLNAEGQFGLAINRGNAAQALGLSTGGRLWVGKAPVPRRRQD